jgi:outer membrane protein OmpA-like peptidoglycan-associated protein
MLVMVFLLLLAIGAGLLYLNQPKPQIPIVEVETIKKTESPIVIPQPEPQPIQQKIEPKLENKIPNDGERIGEKLREVLKPAIPQALSLLPIQKFYFDKNKSKLDAKLRPYLTEAAKELSKPEYQSKHIAVVGFADAKGTDATNCPLSEARAKTVADELHKLSKLVASPLGLCSTRPIGDNETLEGQQMNRRVELWIFDLK